MESWRSIKGFENVYEVSDYGNVRRILKDGTTRPVKIIFRETGGKYSARVWLYNGENVRNVMIARLVWENFVGQIRERDQGISIMYGSCKGRRIQPAEHLPEADGNRKRQMGL